MACLLWNSYADGEHTFGTLSYLFDTLVQLIAKPTHLVFINATSKPILSLILLSFFALPRAPHCQRPARTASPQTCPIQLHRTRNQCTQDWRHQQKRLDDTQLAVEYYISYLAAANVFDQLAPGFNRQCIVLLPCGINVGRSSSIPRLPALGCFCVDRTLITLER